MPLLPPDITIGVEVELLAPRGTSRLDLATALAARIGGSVRRGFHLDTEPSLVPGKPVFHNLTPAFITHGADGGWRYRCTDDLTLQDDLDRDRPPSTDWFRILSDDARILRLIARHVDPDADRVDVLRPVGVMFGARPEPLADGVVRLLDPAGQPLALVASLPGERERPCELVTSPTPAPELDAALRCGLDEARRLGFVAPVEGATHIHLDGRPLQDARALRRFVHLTEPVLPGLRFLLRTNPRCRRLGPWSPALRAAVDAPEFPDLPWTEACARLSTVGLSKYVDLNLKNIVHPSPDKTTIEWRTLPVSLDPGPILRAARLFVAVMARAVGDAPLDLRRVAATPRGVLAWLDQLSLDARDLRAWRAALPA